MEGDRKRILLVDDDLDFVESTKMKLAAMGFTVEVAYDGKEGLKQVPEFKPDLVILDVMMPVMNGREACQKLKANPATQTIPVILLTALADHVTTTTYSHRDVLESNADDYLPKPVRLEVLLDNIKRLL
jgi:DNA-binding response OmpR family regulator